VGKRAARSICAAPCPIHLSLVFPDGQAEMRRAWFKRGFSWVEGSFVKAGFRSSTKRRDGRKERGGSFADATVITPCFLIVILLSIQFMIISFRAVTLQWITTVVMRDIALWRGSSGPTQDSKIVFNYGKSRANTLASSIGIQLDEPQSSSQAFCVKTITNGALSSCLVDTAANWAPGTALQLQLRYNIPLFFTKLLFVNIPTQTVTGTALAVADNFPQNN
jgi:hypothetical protein